MSVEGRGECPPSGHPAGKSGIRWAKESGQNPRPTPTSTDHRARHKQDRPRAEVAGGLCGRNRESTGATYGLPLEGVSQCGNGPAGGGLEDVLPILQEPDGGPGPGCVNSRAVRDPTGGITRGWVTDRTGGSEWRAQGGSSDTCPGGWTRTVCTERTAPSLCPRQTHLRSPRRTGPQSAGNVNSALSHKLGDPIYR